MNMSESYVQLPPNSTGSKVRTIEQTVGLNTVVYEVVGLIDSGSGQLMTATSKEQLPTALTASGNLKISTSEAAITQPVTGSVYAYHTGSWPVSLTGSSASYHDNDNNAIRVNIVAGGLSVTGSTFDFSGSTFVSTGVVSGSVGITGSVTIPVSIESVVVSGSVGITGSANLAVSGGQIGLTGSTYTQAITGSVISTVAGGTIGISGSSPIAVTDGGGSITVDGTTNVAGGSVGITGSITLPITITGAVVSGSVGITGSSNLNTSIIGASITQAISGSTGRTWVLGTGSDNTYAILKDAAGNTTSYVDTSNNALKVNIVAGTTGGLQIRTGSGEWADVGYSGSGLAIPVNIITGNNKSIIVSGSIGITGSTVIPTSLTGSGASYHDADSNAIRVHVATGSSTIPVYIMGGGNISVSSGSFSMGPVSGSVGITGSALLPVWDNGASLTIDGSVGITSGNIGITGSSVIPVSDNGGSLTVDGTVVVSGGSIGITGSSSLNVQGSVGITGSSALNVQGSVGITGSSTLTVQGSVGITGSNNVSVRITGSTVTVPISGSVGRTWALASGSDSVKVHLTDSAGNTAAFFNVGDNAIKTYSIGGSVGVSSIGGVSGSVGITGSTVTLPVYVTSGSSTVGITGSSTTFAITGSTGRTWSLSSGSDSVTAQMTGSITAIMSGTVGITGSTSMTGSVNLTSPVGITGSSTTFAVTGSIATVTTLTSITNPVGITGSTNISGGSIGITGSTNLSISITGSSTLPVYVNSGSISLTGSNASYHDGSNNALRVNVIAGGGSSTISGSVGITGSSQLTAVFQITGSTTPVGVTGSVGTYGSVSLTNTGSININIYSDTGSVLLFASGSGLKVKVYSAGYQSSTNAYHYFYFGNITGSGTNAFLVTSGSGVFSKTFFQPICGGTSQGLYLKSSATSDIGMCVDVQYVVEA